ncbi:two-component system sensor histidine kinase NtrB [Edaphobacter aggregans]|uniref:two-component system sensor histidine kinase NtrB n=1 Tax=Edaphobacter aggregans TaxID=570835 RepID=UPI000689C536|nr:PAS domain S-box protein [Edaphobacter aggregans]
MFILDRANPRAAATADAGSRNTSKKATTFDEPLWQLAGVVESPEEARNTREAAFERKAGETLALLAAIVESSDDAILSNDLNGTVTSWNKGAQHIFGYTPEEILGRPISMLASESCQDDWARCLEKIRRGERVDHYETLRRHKDGSDIAVSLTVSPIRDSSGTIIGSSKVARDITATRQAEQALRNADKLAMAGRMAASIAHEINNPLEAITNLLFLLEHEPLPEQARRYLTLAQHELTRVSHIASQTLGFFRGAPGSTTTPLSDVVDSAISLHIGRLSTCNVAVEKNYAPTPAFFCNQGELRQVLVNLVANALDAMPHGGRLIARVRPAVDPATSTHGVRVVIADTGIGMSSRTQRALFEPFYTTKGATGTGLGLWVSSQIIARHQGRIRVKSSQSPDRHGTVFSIFLPNLPEASGSPCQAPSQQLPLPIDGRQATSHEDESRHTPAQPDQQSTAYTAA